MSHDPEVKAEIRAIVDKIAQALNTEQSDMAEIKAYNKLTVYGNYCYKFEVVVRNPMEPNELEQHRLAKARQVKYNLDRRKPSPIPSTVDEWQRGTHIDSMPKQGPQPINPHPLMPGKTEVAE